MLIFRIRLFAIDLFNQHDKLLIKIFFFDNGNRIFFFNILHQFLDINALLTPINFYF